MSQYYVIANPKKRQMLCPSRFDDGSQICSLHHSLQALALLTSNGNGRGVGDYELPYDAKLDSYPTSKYKSWDEATQDGWKPRDRTPLPQFRLAGSWAGDPVITCGDSGDPGKWVTPADHKKVAEMITEEGREDVVENAKHGEMLIQARIESINLYAVACRLYEDVSDEMVTLLGLCDVGPGAKARQTYDWIEEIDSFLQRYLLSDFNDMRMLARVDKRTKKTYGIYDLSWMPWELLDSLLRSHASRPDQLKSLKKWLLKQKLPPMLRELVPCYKADRFRPNDVREPYEAHSFEKMQEIKRRYGYEDSTTEDRERNCRVLPPRPLLQAALDVHRLLGNPPRPDTRTYAQLMAEMLQRRAIEEAIEQEPVRTRVVDLTTPGT